MRVWASLRARRCRTYNFSRIGSIGPLRQWVSTRRARPIGRLPPGEIKNIHLGVD